MPENLKIMPEIRVELPEKEILRRLGGNPRSVPQDPGAIADIRKCAIKAFDLCRPQGRWCIVAVQAVQQNGIKLENGTFLPGSLFADSCAGCTWLWCAAATVGSIVTDARDSLASMAEKSIYDAVASEVADVAMDHIHRVAARELVRCGRYLSERRYSAGYGDMPLSAQRLTDSFLHLNEMGITLNQQDFMTPEKSVTAWAGIRGVTGDEKL